MKEPNMFHNMKLRKSLIKPVTWQKTCNYIKLFGSSTRDRCMTTHLMLFSERPPMYALCRMISGGRTEQHVIRDFGEQAAVN